MLAGNLHWLRNFLNDYTMIYQKKKKTIVYTNENSAEKNII